MPIPMNSNNIIISINVNTTEYGIIFDMTVPIPISLSYLLAKANITGKYGKSGLIGFVEASHK